MAMLYISLILGSCASLKADLVRLDSFCNNDPAMYECTNNGSSYLHWQLSLLTGQSSYVSLNGMMHREGYVITDRVGASGVEYRLNSASTHFVSGSVTIMNPGSVGGTRITCGGKSLILTTADSILPTSISLIPNGHRGMIDDFLMEWTSIYQAGILEYFITISSPSVKQFVSTNSSIDVSSAIGLKYSIVISVRGCSDGINASFILGWCPFLVDDLVFSIEKYELNSSGQVTAVLKCKMEQNNETYRVECREDGQWDLDTVNSLCMAQYLDIEDATTIPTTTTATMCATNSTDSIMRSKDALSPMPVSLSVAAFISIIFASIICGCFVMLILGVILGVLFRKHWNQREIKHFNYFEQSFAATNKQAQLCDAPVYDEVGPCAPIMDLSPNMAYEFLKKHQST